MTRQQAELWLRKAVGNAPRPLPGGRFPQLLAAGERAGHSREHLLDALDMWLNYGYCQLIEQIQHDVKILPAGEAYFYRM